MAKTKTVKKGSSAGKAKPAAQKSVKKAAKPANKSKPKASVKKTAIAPKATPKTKPKGKPAVSKTVKAAPKKPAAKPAPKSAAKPAAGKPAKPVAKSNTVPAKTGTNLASPKGASPTTKPVKSATTMISKESATAKSKPASPKSSQPAPGAGMASPLQAANKGFTPYVMQKGEEYMNERQKDHFRKILLNWRDELMQEVDRTVHHMQDEAANPPDPADRATLEEEFSLELRTRDRERRLIKKIDSTIELIANDDYGYCDSCGVEIGIRRLEARPTANKCIDCKTLDEIKERQVGSA